MVIRAIYKFFLSRLAVCRGSQFHTLPCVYGLSLLSKQTTLLGCSSFNGMRIYGGGQVTIGDNFHSGRGCKIITQVHNYQGTRLPYDSTYIFKNVEIGDNVWFGMDVTILSSCKIGEGAIIQAGSVVVGDIPPLAIAGGNPARVFKYRDKNHYYEKKENPNT